MASSVTIVDQCGRNLVPLVGRDDSLARSRLVSALRLQSRELVSEVMVAGITARPRVVVHRLVSAARVAATRAL
jgi:hypothetical protein